MTRLVVFGLSVTSSWGNGHATTYRGLLRALAARGWQVTFFEQDVEWYRHNRDLPRPGFCDLRLYEDFVDLRRSADPAVRSADAVLVGSYAGEAIEILDWLPGVAHVGERHALRVAVVRILGGEPEPTEHDAVRWLAADELDDVDWLGPDRPFLPGLRAVLSAQ